MSRLLPLVIATFVLGVSCGGPTTPTPPPPPPPTPQLSVSCPTSLSIDTETAPLVVNYSAPVTSGGSAPVQTSCTINSGASFVAGNTDIICTATDTAQRQSQCTFSVKVNVLKRLKGTTFLAFGDSITWGEVSQPKLSVHDFDAANNYPVVLGGLLKERYTLQSASLVVTNAGEQGETVAKGEDRFVSLVNALRPDAVLLLEGSNDVNQGSLNAHQIVQSLRSNIRRAYQRGVRTVFLATLPPEVPGGIRATHPEGIDEVNDEIRRVASLENAVLVDIHAAIKPQQDLLIGVDGLHPTIAGYRKMAETFLESIRVNFEEPAPAAGGATPQSLLSRPRRSW